MKRKLVQVETDDESSPPKLYQTTESRNARNMELLDRLPPFGRPSLSSTPVASARNVANFRDSHRAASAAQHPPRHHQTEMTPLRHQQQQQLPRNHHREVTFDLAAEEEVRRIVDNFVTIYEQLDKCEGADVKPNYSYTELAYLAMLRSPNFCLPINQIYNYIQSRFLFFKNSTRKHWRNAVRHSLAKTMCFTKIPVGRGKSNSENLARSMYLWCILPGSIASFARGRGKSNSENLARSMYLWCILPGSIASFARGDYRPTVDKDSGTNTLRWGYFHMNAGQFWDQVGNYIAHKMTNFKRTLECSPVPGKIFESQVCNLPLSQQPQASQRRPLGQHNGGHGHQDLKQNRNQVQYEYTAPSMAHPQFLDIQDTVPLVVPSAYIPTASMPTYQGKTNVPFVSPQSTPDPWLPKTASPDISMCSIESDRRTPPYLSFDSGNETNNSSPETSSCRFSGSCVKQTANDRVPSPFPGFQQNSNTFDDSGFNHLELSALADLDFSQNQLQSFEQLQFIPSSFPEIVGCDGAIDYSMGAVEREQSSSCYLEGSELDLILQRASPVSTQVPNMCNGYLVSHTTPYAW